MMRILTSLTAGLLAAVLGGPASAQRPADLVLKNGRIHTVDERFGTVEALAARGDRIVAVGSNAEIEALIGARTEVRDLGGRTAIPGFIEGHAHFVGMGDALQVLDLMQVRSWEEVVEMVAEATKTTKPGDWILGRGWHQEKWDAPPPGAVEGFPVHEQLSAVSPRHPVRLTHASGHASFVNAKAMELSGIGPDTKDPAGGEILRDADGAPIGVLRETAQGLVAARETAGALRRSADDQRRAIERSAVLADRECLSKGVTSIQDAGSTLRTIDVLRDMAERGDLGVRLWVMIRDRNERLARELGAYRMVGIGNHHLTVRALKRSIDGALGPRGAWLLEPYEDAPDSTGLNTATVPSVEETARLAVLHGFQLCVHAIGDRANREVLDLFERTFRAHPDLHDPRWRVEHAQHLSAADIPRFAGLGAIASMQGVHCTSDAVYVLARLGEQRAEEGAYVWRSLIDSGALVINGTDAPVENVDPIASFCASVTRQLSDGSTFFPEQCMTRQEALRSYTIDAAYAAFEEDLKGSLVPGKLADITVLSQDLLSVSDEQLPETRVGLTIVGGKVRYEN
ncbi:MAG: amidohydrolase [Planctomycetota bacterium]